MQQFKEQFMARSRKYEDFLHEHLQDHDEAVAYLLILRIRPRKV